jgi:hypothetical protein
MVARRLRAVTFAALAAATAAVAHGGLAALARPAWAIPAFAGALIATLVMWRGWMLVARRGHVPSGGASLASLIPAMLAAQAAAHVALLASGVPSHDGAGGSLALHLALAVVAALLVHRIDAHTLERAARALAVRFDRRTPVPRPSPRAVPRSVHGRRPLGRSPPVIA